MGKPNTTARELVADITGVLPWTPPDSSMLAFSANLRGLSSHVGQ